MLEFIKNNTNYVKRLQSNVYNGIDEPYFDVLKTTCWI